MVLAVDGVLFLLGVGAAAVGCSGETANELNVWLNGVSSVITIGVLALFTDAGVCTVAVVGFGVVAGEGSGEVRSTTSSFGRFGEACRMLLEGCDVRLLLPMLVLLLVSVSLKNRLQAAVNTSA